MKVTERRLLPVGLPRRTYPAIALVTLLLGAAGVLFGMTLSRVNTDLDDAHRVEVTAAYLRPIGTLLAELVVAQATTAAGAVADAGALERALTEVDRAQEVLGADLSSSTRWADLRARIVPAIRGTGPDAARNFGELAALTKDFTTVLADRSGALRDDRVNTQALADAVAVQVPDVLVASGAYVQAVAAAQVPDRDAPDGADAVATGPEVAARTRLAQIVEDLDLILIRGVETATLSADEILVGRAAEFRSAAGALVPPAAFADVVGAPADLAELRDLQGTLVRAGSGLHGSLLADLVARSQDLRATLLVDLLVVWAAGAVVLALAVWLLWAAAGRRVEDDPEDADGIPPSAVEPHGADGVVMVDARSLLGDRVDAEELVRVGRAVRKQRGSDDARA